MASRTDERLWHAAWLAVIVLGTVACSSAEEVKLDTIELADGEFYGLAWGGTQVERFHVLARPGPRGEKDPNALVLVSPQHPEPCDLGPTQRYYTQQPRSGSKYVLGSPSPARLALFDEIDEHGIGTLSFADIDCKRTDLTLPDLEADTLLRLYPPDLEQLLLGVRDRDRNVLLVDPWGDHVTDIAQHVDNVWVTDNAAWFLEDGVLVKRDFTGRERRRVGTSVTQFLSLGGPGDFAYVDEGKLIVERGGKSTQLATDMCLNSNAVRGLDPFIPGAIAYFSPCDTRRLVVQPVVGKAITYQPDVASYTAQRGQLFIAYDDAQTNSTAIFTALAREPNKPMKWIELPHVSLSNVTPVRNGHWLMQVQNDDNTFSLLRLTDSIPSDEPETVVAAADSIVQASRSFAWLVGGELTVRDANAEATLLRASEVARFNYVFPGSSPAIVYTRQVDRATGLGRMELKFLNGDAFTLARDVREYREVWWPERGILYARGGSRAGINFARIEVPCEMTSDSPWACGF
jgi:hypothetical protein